MVVLTEKFRFIKEDIFLCPWVDTKTGKQKLIMQKYNIETDEIEFEDSIDCIHAAITDISPERFNKFQDDKEIQDKLVKKTLLIRSSENFREINLHPEEKFKALKSWVAGIAELGINALQVQSEIENAASLAHPMIERLFRFITKADPKFIYQYLSKIEKECKFEGVNHKSSLIANILPILRSIQTNRKISKLEKQKILSAILAINPPYELFEKNPHFIYLLNDFPVYFINFRSKIIEKYSNIIVKLLDINQKVEKILEFLKILWLCFKIDFEFLHKDKKFISKILEIYCSDEIYHSIEDDYDLYPENYSGGIWMLNFILDDLNILDALDSFSYTKLSLNNPSFLKKLMDEARKKSTENKVINYEHFDKYLNKITELIYAKYNYEPDFEEKFRFGGSSINKQEKEIVLTSLNKEIPSSTVSRFLDFFTHLILDLLDDPWGFKNYENIIATLLSSENPDFLAIIPPKMFRWVIPFDDITRRLFFEKIEEKYNSNKEKHENYLIKKCTEFLNLLILNPQEVEELKKVDPDYEDQLYYYTYNHAEDVYYYSRYYEILKPLFKICPPVKLFAQNRLFFEFLRLSDAIKIPEYKDYIYTAEPEMLRRFMGFPESIDELPSYLKEMKQKFEGHPEFREKLVRTTFDPIIRLIQGEQINGKSISYYQSADLFAQSFIELDPPLKFFSIHPYLLGNVVSYDRNYLFVFYSKIVTEFKNNKNVLNKLIFDALKVLVDTIPSNYGKYKNNKTNSLKLFTVCFLLELFPFLNIRQLNSLDERIKDTTRKIEVLNNNIKDFSFESFSENYKHYLKMEKILDKNGVIKIHTKKIYKKITYEELEDVFDHEEEICTVVNELFHPELQEILFTNEAREIHESFMSKISQNSENALIFQFDPLHRYSNYLKIQSRLIEVFKIEEKYKKIILQLLFFLKSAEPHNNYKDNKGIKTIFKNLSEKTGINNQTLRNYIQTLKRRIY